MSFLNRIPLRKLFIWAAFLSLIYVLRDFFGILIGTFVISYIGNSLVNRYQDRVKDRRILVLGYFSTIILLVTGFGFWAVPLAISESKEFINKVQKDDPYIFVYEQLREALGPKLTARLEKAVVKTAKHSGHGDPIKVDISPTDTGFSVNIKELPKPHKPLKKDGPDSKDGDPKNRDAKQGESKKGEEKGQKGDGKDKPEKELTPEEIEAEKAERKRKAEQIGQAIQHNLKEYISLAISVLSKFLGTITKAVLQTGISLIFAFLIVWDMPSIRLGMRGLEKSRLGEAYAEVAPSVVSFGALLGKAFQAQTIIALVNTALTAIGMLILGIPGIGILSLIVFICSFIPVAGVFISTAPIAIIGLTSSGIGTFVAVIVMVMVVHAVEAYMLNPIIYSAHLKLHPLLVLIVLVLAEHTVGVWGLIIAVPFTVYIFRHVIHDATREERIATSVDLIG